MIDQNSGLLTNATYIASPNCNQRPVGTSIDLLVIHGISLPAGQFGGDAVQALFTNTLDISVDPSFANLAKLHVSAHLFIRREGSVIQFVPFHLRAWHAGVSHFDGKDNCNDFSIGVELEGTDEIPYTVAQYQQLVIIISQLQETYPGITSQRIVGHNDIAPGRKTDPGPAFDWQYLKDLLEQRHYK